MKEKTKKRIKGIFEFVKFSTGLAAGIGSSHLVIDAFAPTINNNCFVKGSGIQGVVKTVLVSAGVLGISTAVGMASIKAMDEGLDACYQLVVNATNSKKIKEKFKEVDGLVDEAIKKGVDIDILRGYCDKIGEIKNMKNLEGAIEYLDILIFEIKAEIASIDSDKEDEDDA